MKVLLVSNTGWNLYNFRRPIARILREYGYEPVMVSPRDEFVPKLIADGYRWIELPMDRKGINPLRELKTFFNLLRIYKTEKPKAVHHFTVKCVIYGSFAARVAKIGGVINGITGLGHVFLQKSWLLPWVKSAYRLAFFGTRTRLIFQNADDLSVFTEMGLIKKESAVLIRSSGVDLQRFSPTQIESTSQEPIVLFAGRLIKEKGIHDFVDAALLLRARGIKARFEVAGESDPGNPSALSDDEIRAMKDLGVVHFLGRIDRIEEKIAEACMVVLPSYREGVPRILLEASAMQKPIVATDVPGCREVVKSGENGFLVPVREPEALSQAIATILLDSKLSKKMGEAGRKKVIEEFDDRSVASSTWKVYQELGLEAV
jgi:glycosyltransferase involved in cell wall biosynthesis